MVENRRFTRIGGDGNCLFRCIARTYYRSEQRYNEVRNEVVRSLIDNRAKYESDPYIWDSTWVESLTGIDGSYDTYLQHVITNKCWGDTLCLIAFHEVHPDFRYSVWARKVPRVERKNKGDAALPPATFTERYLGISYVTIVVYISLQ